MAESPLKTRVRAARLLQKSCVEKFEAIEHSVSSNAASDSGGQAARNEPVPSMSETPASHELGGVELESF
jgi:hypothetical protein